jgi:L-cysteine desulfidase
MCYVNVPSKKKVKKAYTNILLYGRNIKEYFDKLYTEDLEYVCIEQQMTSKMRIISYMIAQYFIGKNTNINVIMCNACYKLKDLEIEKTSYDERKKNSIKHVLNFLDDPTYASWKPFFNKNKKQDDLSDAFLQGKWAINNYKL